MENILLSVVTPYLIPAFAVNVLLDLIKKVLKSYPQWLLPLLCVVFSVVIPIIYQLLPIEGKPDDVLMQTFGIMGLSYFFYDAGGYSFIKEKLSKKNN